MRVPPSENEPQAALEGPPDLAETGPSKKRIAVVLMSGAMLSKVLGLVREIAMAQIIGVAMVADGFRTAVTAILLPLAFLQNESVPAILIPMMQDARKAGDAPRRLAALAIALTLVGILLAVLMETAGRILVDSMVAGFTPEGQALTMHFVRILSLSMPASVLLNCYAAGEIALGITRITNIRASILNIGIMTGLLMLFFTGYADLLAWSFTATFNLLALWATVTLAREGHLTLRGLGVGMVARLGLDFLRRLRPFLVLPAAEQGNIWLERLLASRIVTGAVASLDYARTLTDSALLLVSQPIGLAVLAGKQADDERAQAEAITRPVLAVAMPVSAFLFVFAPDIVRLVFQRGAFDEHGVMLTAQALSGISVGLWASTLGWILIRLLNNSSRNLTVAGILILSYAANVLFNIASQRFDAGDHGVMVLGLGEAVRGAVLLTAVVLALECRGVLARLVLIGLAPAGLMLLVGFEITAYLPPSFGRLVLGGAVCGATIVLAAAVLCPALLIALLAAVRAKLPGGSR